MYYDMWVNDPKEVFEYDDYTYEEHFGKPIPSYVTVPVIRDYLEGRKFSYSRFIFDIGGKSEEKATAQMYRTG